MDPSALAIWATLAVTVFLTVVSTAWSLGRSSTTKREVDTALTTQKQETESALKTLKADTDHSFKNIRQAALLQDGNFRTEFDKLWAAQRSIERDYARRDDVRDMGDRLGGKMDRLEEKLDEFNNHLIGLLKVQAATPGAK